MQTAHAGSRNIDTLPEFHAIRHCVRVGPARGTPIILFGDLRPPLRRMCRKVLARRQTGALLSAHPAQKGTA